ncbi:MAG: esterase-like activity of phytase family protein [Actinomycetota bacterium]|nr:esterase-like activity of phytase family protein [Actinomycetota bacterium]MDQ2955620.1 esterase-like activity of phytase family protein [Actinomycetota bacterium]
MRKATVTAIAVTALGASLLVAASADAQPTDPAQLPAATSRLCAPSALALNFSDSLDKLVYHGVELGGLSSLAYDRRSTAWVSAVDNHASDPSRIWFFRNLVDPQVIRDPLVLKRPDGSAYDGTTADNEGLAVLPDGDYLLSSETEPSIRIFGRDGVQKAELPVPARFAVTGRTPAGQATSNATLEGLTITPSGNRIIAAMEGALSGDVSATGDANLHRFLVYDADRHGRWTLTKQISYRTEAGLRVPEVAAYSENSFVVEEAAFAPATGNAVELFAVTGLNRAADVSSVGNLSQAPAASTVRKKLVANLVDCPTLAATSKETQTNPLLDNFEGMALTTPDLFGFAGLSLISDDNFSAGQTTRVLNLAVRLP